MYLYFPKPPHLKPCLKPCKEHLQCPPLPAESVDISQYGAVFNAHLQECMAKRMLPMASDVAELMLCKQLEVQAGLLQTLLDKLGKQSPWHRAREIFVRKSLQARTNNGSFFRRCKISTFLIVSHCVF